MNNIKKAPLVTVPLKLAQTIESLSEQLKATFGCDYSYLVMGKGHIVAANTLFNGSVKPVIENNP